MHEVSFFSDPVIWYITSFLFFFWIVYKWVRKPVLGMIDAEIAKVRDELEKARKLRVEAEAVLAEYQLKQQSALAEAEEIVEFAKSEAASLRVRAEEELKVSLARHEQQAMDRIKLAEADALEDVKTSMVNLAMAAARKILAEKMNVSASDKLIDQAIAELPRLKVAKSS
ncbi:MAG: F0F1 ATP synthase subunit B [Alphaproteobacteria bacterium]|nr:F0F1 ATP synthase subunit B [Alphaproteobacteria bacterium]